MHKYTHEISNELQVYRFRHGVKLVQPDIKSRIALDRGKDTPHTVSSLLNLPFSIYFDDMEGRIQTLNDHNVELCGFDSVHHARGKSYFGSFTTKSADAILNNDQQVMKTQTWQILEEDIQHYDGKDSQSLSVKMPWYADDNKVIGLFGCSINMTKDSLATSLSLLTGTGLLNVNAQMNNVFGIEVTNVYLSKQQTAIARHLLAGHSIKAIGARLRLSPRTVETYIDLMKTKLKCRNKTELIVKLARIDSIN